MKKIGISFLLIVLFLACSNQNSELFDKLQGTWKIDNENEFEKWSKNKDGSYNSLMYSVKVKDTVYSENVKIYKSGENWIFETHVKNQNQGKAVKFESTLLSNTEVTFENPAHDFPKLIHYSLESPSVLRAYIAGNSDTVLFNFSKVK